jgi:hypothetical protein
VSIRHLVHVDLIKHDAHSHARSTLVVVDEDELSALGFWDVSEEMALFLFVFLLD